jgi:hypothetical protein
MLVVAVEDLILALQELAEQVDAEAEDAEAALKLIIVDKMVHLARAVVAAQVVMVAQPRTMVQVELELAAAVAAELL